MEECAPLKGVFNAFCFRCQVLESTAWKSMPTIRKPMASLCVMHISSWSSAISWWLTHRHHTQLFQPTTSAHSLDSTHLVLSQILKTLTLWMTPVSWPFHSRHQNESGWLHSWLALLRQLVKTAASTFCSRRCQNNLLNSLFVCQSWALTNFRQVYYCITYACRMYCTELYILQDYWQFACPCRWLGAIV